MRIEARLLPFLFWAYAATACDVSSSAELGSAGASTGGGTANGATGGAGPSTPGGGASPPSGDGAFILKFRDDFDAFDASRWQTMTHSWDTNLALFSGQTVAVEEGEMRIRLLQAPPGTADDSGKAKPYLGAEVRSFDTLTYGRVRARLKFAKGPGVISSLVTIYTPWPADDWNELDVECLGKEPAALQLNTMVYTGPPTQPPVTTPVSPTAKPFKPTLGFDPTEDFHVYTIEWTPESARFLVDDALLYTWTEHIDFMKLPQNVLLTIWASSSASWAGAVGEATVGAEARYDWVELYDYAPPEAG
jgi:endo-1,3-1,4-beta-glycanase ExoK